MVSQGVGGTSTNEISRAAAILDDRRLAYRSQGLYRGQAGFM